jgi:hypothetical protein
MVPQLSSEQQLALEEGGGRPIEVVHPGSQKMYVLISRELYARLLPLFEDKAFDIRETYAAQDAALAKVWDDSELDLYNDYDAHQPK